MNKFFNYVGIICLVVFSFFYTEKVVYLTNHKDPIVKSIMSYEELDNTECVEGYIKGDNAVLGVNGKSVNVNKSYRNMRGIGFNEDLIVYDETECKINKDKVLDKYIIKGNEFKNSMSLLLIVNDGSYLEEIINICKEKDVKISLVVNGSMLETNSEYMEEIYREGFDILYNGTDEADLRKYQSIMKRIDKEAELFCVFSQKNNIINLCGDKNINSIKSNIIIEKNYFMNIKNNVEKGNFIILKENEELVKELSASINFIFAKGIKINTITNHLSEEM